MMRNLLLTFFGFFLSGLVLAQDPQFSQFYAAPLYLNPGYTGTIKDSRLILNHRNQWPALPQAFVTYAMSFDYSYPELNSGFGLMAFTDKAGTANLRNTNLSGFYSYKVHLQDKWVLSPGIQFSYVNRSLDFTKLVFGSQLGSGGLGAPIDPDMSNLQNVHFFDFSSGIVAYNEKIWIGMAAHHMNQPNTTFIDDEARLPMKFTAHAGFKVPLYKGPRKLDRINSIAPSFIYKRQGSFDQLDIGLHFFYEPIMLGLWYRGIPLQSTEPGDYNQDAVVVLFGLKFAQFDVGYSYDITVSRLGANVGGAHEISLRYEFDMGSSKRVKRREKFIPCPSYF